MAERADAGTVQKKTAGKCRRFFIQRKVDQ